MEDRNILENLDEALGHLKKINDNYIKVPNDFVKISEFKRLDNILNIVYVDLNNLRKNLVNGKEDKGVDVMEDKFLPIGSVVKLKNSEDKIMIVGYSAVEYHDGMEIYDYMGCSYPMGLLLNNKMCSFNHDDILECIFTGYKDEEYQVFNEKLNRDEIIDDELTEALDDVAPVEEEPIKEEVVSENFFDNSDSVPYLFDDVDEVDTMDIPISDEESPVGEDLDADIVSVDAEDSTGEFKMPHYRFDENGIIISE